ncbi:MAG: CYTH domain-containing protein [Elusimicrobia bacterium]|nr:CYTH domain-containing protein [Elusimicrobiota bacterium]
MGREIERKFLVAGDGWRGRGTSSRLRQGYLCASKERSVRVRLEGRAGTLTVKGPSRGAARDEYEYRIPARDAAELLERHCLQPLIDKTRTRLRWKGLVWEIDEFRGDNRGLIVAEVELPRADRAVELPPWAGAEVTGDPRYLNASLLRRPYRLWGRRRKGRTLSS